MITELKPVHKRLDGAQTVLKAANVLSIIGRLKGARFSEIAREANLSNPTLNRLLTSLIEARLVHHDKELAQYRLGSETYVLGQLAQPEFSFHDLARDSLAHLAKISGDTAFLTALDGLSTICLHREERQYPIRTHVLNVGDRHPLGLGAGAIAILAALSDEEATEILELNKEAIHNVRPELDLTVLTEHIQNARTLGYGLNPGLVFPGSWAIAAVIKAPSGEILGALTIAAIESRLTDERQKELSIPLFEEVRRIEQLLAKFGQNGLRFMEAG